MVFLRNARIIMAPIQLTLTLTCEAGDEEEETDAAARVVYRASFQELMPNYLPYDTIIWALISLLLVLAWGIGLLLLLYLPYKRYVLKRDILSRQLFVTDNKIVYKVLVNLSS